MITNPDYPNCPSRTGDACSHVSDITGNAAITPTVCLLCRYQGGPYCGSKSETPDEFLTALTNYRKGPQNKRCEITKLPITH